MIDIQIVDHIQLMAFWLIFTRLVTIIFQLPLFEESGIPAIVKILSSLLLTFAFFNDLYATVRTDIVYWGVDRLWVLTIFYTLVGLLIGFLVKSIMGLFVGSGSMITQQIGFGAISYFDPTSSQQVGPFEKLIHWTILVLIISSGALLPMIKGIFQSFHSIHMYDIGKLAHSVPFFMNFFKSLFTSSIMLASPLIFTNMITMTILGIVARAVPQLNIIMVSFVINIGLGLLVFAACSDEFFVVAFKMYTRYLGEWFQFVI